MTAQMEIEKAFHASREFPEELHGVDREELPRIRDILAGILLLAARESETIPLAKVHSVIHTMKPHEPILSGVRFSLTGSICFSRDIYQAVAFLTDRGFLKIDDGSTHVEGRIPEFLAYLSGFLTNSQIQVIHSASLRFHERVRWEQIGPRCPR